MRYNAKFLDKEQSEWNREYSVLELNINTSSHRSDERTRVLVYDNKTPILLIHVFIEIDKDGFLLDSCFSGLLCNEQYVVVMLGQHIHLVEIASKKIKTLYLYDFVCYIYPTPNCTDIIFSENFLVTTYCYVFLLNVTEGIVWRSQMCGLDGVRINNINDGVIYGEGEWDPPGGWSVFSISLDTGLFLP